MKVQWQVSSAQRGPARLQKFRPRPVATMEWIPPPVPRRDEHVLFETAGPAAHGKGLRPKGRRALGPHRRPEQLHRARNLGHRGCGISLFGERVTSTITKFAQQSPMNAQTGGPAPFDPCASGWLTKAPQAVCAACNASASVQPEQEKMIGGLSCSNKTSSLSPEVSPRW
jgi:hypothetical protein